MDTDQLFNAALRRARAGDCRNALAPLGLAASLGEESAELYRLMGKVFVHLGEVERAADAFSRALAIGGNDRDAALCLDTLRRFRCFRRVLAAVALVSVVGMASLAVWIPWRASRRHDTAVAAITAPGALRSVAVTRSETDVRAKPRIEALPGAPRQPGLGSALFDSQYRKAVEIAFRGDLAGALALLRPLSAEEYAGHPLAGNVHFWMGRCLYQLGQTQEALAHFQRVLDQYPDCRKYGEAVIDEARCRHALARAQR